MKSAKSIVRGHPLIWVAFLSLSLPDTSPAAGRVRLGGHVPLVVPRLTPLGNLPPGRNLSLAVGLPLRNQGELEELLAQLQDRRSTNYHKYLTPSEFTERFGPTVEQYQSVIRFARSNGLRVAAMHSNRLLVNVEGSVSNIERAFQIKLQIYSHPAEPRTFFAPDTEPDVPADLPVADMWGLSDYSLPRPLSRRTEASMVTPLNYNGSGPGGSYQGSDFRKAYAPGAALTGSGQTAAVAEFDGYYASDITTYEKNCGYSNVPLQNVLVDGVSGVPGYSGQAGAVAEVSLDIEMVISMAPGLAKVMVYEGSNPYNVFNRIATDNIAKQISCSWAWSYGPTRTWGRPGIRTLDAMLQQMAAQGQSFFQASGDADAYTGSQALNSLTGPIPEDSVYVTCVGGTTLSMNGTGASWASETVWNWGGNTGSGGGISPNYGIPSWQVNTSMTANGGSTTYRNIPDVALTADAINVVYNNGSSGIFGGTSCAAPLWAGFTALVNQQAAAAGQPPAGFLNPALYAVGTGPNYTSCFHDTTTGNNIGTNTPGMFYAVPGYDLCTGWGTPNGTNLINALAPHPYIATPPANQTVASGSNATFRVAAGGAPPFAYSWFFNGARLSSGGNVLGADSNVLTLVSVTSGSAGDYSVVVTNGYGTVTSSAATLTIIFPPSFTLQPANQNVVAGDNAVFSAAVSGALPLTYQWQKNGANIIDGLDISGATTDALTLAAVTPENAGNYRLIVSNIYGSVTSSIASLTVVQPPVIVAAPAAQTAQCGSNAVFSVSASGTPPLNYQWSLDGVAITAATSATLLLPNVHLPDHTIQIVVSNLYGSATSSVSLTVQDTLPPVITLAGNNPSYVELGGTFTDPGATANDLCAGVLPAIASGAVDTGVLGTNLIVYAATDGQANIGTAARTVIVRDTTPPTVLWSFTNLTLVAVTNCAAPMPDVTGTNYIAATDLSGPTTVSQAPSADTDLSVGTNIVVISVSDTSGNTSYSTNEIIVLDQSPPLILVAPESQTNTVGATVAFTFTATACTPLAFQWFFNDTPLAGQTTATLTLSDLTPAAAGNYFLVATASGGSTTSSVATLTVNLLASSVALASSLNPGGFGDGVSFSAAIAPATATGTIQFFANDAAFDLVTVVAGTAVSTNSTSLPRGTNLIAAVYSGDANNLPSTNTLLQVVTNHPPVAAEVFYSRVPGTALEIAITNLAAYWTDVDGDIVSLAAVDASTNGVTLTNNGGTLLYVNPNSVPDQFICTVADNWGGTNFQTVTIGLVLPSITGVASTSGGVTLGLSGAPGSTYILEATTNLFPADWVPITSTTLATNGVWQFTDPDAVTFPQRYYRLKQAQ